jgi:hypothetical protein
MDTSKIDFITTGFLQKMEGLTEEAKPLWGVMNAQEMVEHLADFFNIATEKIKVELVTPEEQLPRYMEFLMSDKPFKENTKAPVTLIGEKPLPLRFASLQEAKNSLKKAVKDFTEYFRERTERKTLHPVFGELNFGEWTKLHYKHVVHHLTQFSLL